MNSTAHSITASTNQLRKQLDRLFAVDAVISLAFGVFALGTPHGVWTRLVGETSYNHDVHEILRLYGCLKLACGYILYHVRRVDDGIFRKHVCEALLVCYICQALAVTKAQFSNTPSESSVVWYLNWLAIVTLSLLAYFYGSFRFGQGGHLIKVYELPTSRSLV
jgi:hypothetical protein